MFGLPYLIGYNNKLSCANGKFLILDSWEHHNEKIITSRQQCLMSNKMEEHICKQCNKTE